MRSFLKLLLLACAILSLAGCAFMSDEDRDFYGKGWIHPTELDGPMSHHAIPNPENPSSPAVGNPTGPPDPRDPTATGDAWATPAPPLNGAQ